MDKNNEKYQNRLLSRPPWEDDSGADHEVGRAVPCAPSVENQKSKIKNPSPPFRRKYVEQELLEVSAVSIGAIAMSGLFGEKSPQVSFAALESHKIGGIVRLPREIDEQSIVPMGQFLARYGAIEFARTEDNFGFMANGDGTFDSVKGIVQIARDTNHTLSLAAGKTKPSDATLDDFRTLRTKINKAALSGRLSAYYLDSTWETRLPAFRTQSEPNVYQRLPDGTAVLDGYPIVWTDVLQPYDTAATPSKCLAVFGALSFWWMGEHGHPRIDTSIHVYFDNDQLAVRCIEEIDFDYCAQDATAALITAAA